MVISFFNIIRWYLISDFAVLLTWINAAIVTGVVSTAAQFAWEISNLTGGLHGYPKANSWETLMCFFRAFTGCRKDEGLASVSRAAAVVRTSAAGEPLKILRLNFILQIEYKHRGFLAVGNEEVVIPCWDKSIFAVERGRKEKAILSMEQWVSSLRKEVYVSHCASLNSQRCYFSFRFKQAGLI